MHYVPLTSNESNNWHCTVMQSDDAWFWHSPDWLEFVKAVGAGSLVEDLSFLIYNDRDVVAICPVILEERDGYRRFSYLGEFIPFPAFRQGITPYLRLKAIEFYAKTLSEFAAIRDVAYTRVAVPVLAPSSISGGVASNPLLRHGYLDLPAATQLISLQETEEALWSAVRKGHKSDIKRAKSACEIRFWERESITNAKFDEYRLLHARDAGRVTRSSVTFEIMLGWIRQGTAILVEASHSGAAAAFALVILFREGAYYASSCTDPEMARVSAMHLIQWELIRWLKSRGVRNYDIGAQFFGPRWDYVPSAKDISIAGFKRGLGGITRRVDSVERFFSASVLEKVAEARVKALVDAHARERAPCQR